MSSFTQKLWECIPNPPLESGGAAKSEGRAGVVPQRTTSAARAETPSQSAPPNLGGEFARKALFVLLLAMGVVPAAAEAQVKTEEAKKQPEETQTKPEDSKLTPVPGGKALGMSILGNQEAPKALVIVPWKSSELGNGPSVSTILDDSRLPIDKEVFMRMLSYYEIRSATARPAGAPANASATAPATPAPRRKP